MRLNAIGWDAQQVPAVFADGSTPVVDCAIRDS